MNASCRTLPPDPAGNFIKRFIVRIVDTFGAEGGKERIDRYCAGGSRGWVEGEKPNVTLIGSDVSECLGFCRFASILFSR